MTNPNNPQPYPTHFSTPWDGPLQTYLDAGDTALFNMSMTLTNGQVLQAQQNLKVDPTTLGSKYMSHGYRVALLGASITANNGDSSLVVNPGVSSYGALDYGIARWANMYMGGPMNFIANPSHGGYTSAQILSNLPTALAANPDIILGHDWWINDIILGVSLATSQANISSIIAQANAAGVLVILTDYLPLTAYNTAAMLKQQWDMDNWLRSIQTRGFMYVSICDETIDPTTGLPLSWATYDGTHPSPKGAHYLGKRLAEQISHLFVGGWMPPKGWSTVAAPGTLYGSPYELVANPMPNAALGSGVAANWAISGSASPVGSVIQRTDFPNLVAQRIQLTAGTNASPAVAVVQIGVNSGAGLTWGSQTMVPGTTQNRMQVEFRMPSVSAIGAWACFEAYMFYTPASDSVYALQDSGTNGSDQGLIPDDSTWYVAQSPAHTLPPGSTAIGAAILIYGTAGAVIDIGRASMTIGG